MFALRGMAVSFSIFILMYAVLSLVVVTTWRKVWQYGQRHSARGCADLLFWARLFPFAAAASMTLALAVPSFLLLEPRAGNEAMGAVPVALGLGGLGVLSTGMWKGVTALAQARRTVKRWSRDARRFAASNSTCAGSISVRRISESSPPLTAAGIFRPSVWLSRAAEFVLSDRELQSALRHEMAHVHRRDNLRKLVLRLVAFPGMSPLESAWREATEMAADDAAVASAAEALDLAAAVIKLSRLACVEVPAALTTALVHSSASSLNARVERLIAWTEARPDSASQYSFRYLLFAATAAVIIFAITYSELLVRVHTATEWLIR